MQGTKSLTEGPILKQLINLAIPIMATSFIQMAYTLTDMVWIGRLGSEAMAAIGSVGILTWMSGSLSLLNKVGSEVSIGQAIGAKNESTAKKFASHNITLALILSVIWGTILFIFAAPIIHIYNLSHHITENAVEYLRIICTAFPFLFISSAFTGIYNGCGKSTTPFLISGSGLIINMVLDPLFIFGFNWGITGAAIATWISQGFVFLFFLYKIKIKKYLLGGFIFFIKPESYYTKRIIKIGLPVAIFNMLFTSVNMIMSRFASQEGGHIGLMTLTTGGQIEAITWNTSQGFSTALGAFVAQNYGAGKYKRVIKAYKTTLGMASVFGIIGTVLFVFFGKEIFSVFVSEKEAFKAGAIYLRISGYSQLFMMLEIATQGLFYGTGHSLPPAIVGISFNYLRIPLSLFFISIGMGITGVWWSISITAMLKGIIIFCCKCGC